jgi:WD40 repeat protein
METAIIWYHSSKNESEEEILTSILLLQISVSWDQSIIVWDINRDINHQKKVIDDAHPDYILDVEYSPERNEVASASADGKVKIWTFGKWENVNSLIGHQGEVSQVKWCAWEPAWITASNDMTARIWNPNGSAKKAINLSGIPTALALDSVSSLIILALNDHVIRAYSIQTGQVVQENAGHADGITQLLHIPELNQYASASWDGTVRLWAAPAHPILSGGPSGALLNKQVKQDVEKVNSLEELVASEKTFAQKFPLMPPRALADSQKGNEELAFEKLLVERTANIRGLVLDEGKVSSPLFVCSFLWFL